MRRWRTKGLVLRGHRGHRALRLSPPATLGLLFIGLSLVGTLLLKLPFAAREPIGWLDAAFTATSAVTVTGLTVLDTGGDFTTFGQAVILLLIQLGGLGLMTFAALVLTLLGHRIGLRQQVLLREDLNQTSLGGVVRMVRPILLTVLAFEAAGTALLALHWVPLEGWRQGLWLALFHAVSAFNNAGFGLYPDSLMRFADSPLLNLVVPVLIICGGLGFSCLCEAYQGRRWRRLSMHSKLMAVGTGALLAWGFLGFALLEWDNPATLGGLDGAWARLQAAWFQAVTPRTAGFNTVDIGAVEHSTALMLISLMFIGGGSTSTAGGIKVTTFIVLVLGTHAFLTRRQEPSAFGRRIPPNDILKVLAVTFISLLVVMVSTFLLTVTQRLGFLDLAFEATSAFGTVGLSRGVTAELDAAGRLIIMVTMLVGRAGPLALGFALATATTAGRVRYPPARVQLG